jgi:parallel beta-helix repeat protein
VFVDGYVSGVVLRDLEIAGAGGVGVYLEAGSRDNVVTRCDIHDNGYGDVDPAGIPIVIGGVTFRYLSTGREGIAIDGSRDNRILRNRIARNSAGGIFLSKNCGEDFTSRPAQWWERRYGADGNVIVRNDISDGNGGDVQTGAWGPAPVPGARHRASHVATRVCHGPHCRSSADARLAFPVGAGACGPRPSFFVTPVNERAPGGSASPRPGRE